MSEIFCYKPSDAEYTLVDGYIVSFYDVDLENPYEAENADEKIHNCVDILDLDKHEMKDNERWIRFDYESIMEGNPQRV